MTKKQGDYVMAGLFGLLVVCTGVTLWLYTRYQQAAAAVETVLDKGLQARNGRIIMPAVQEQAIADARLRTFLVMGVLTGICALLLAALVLWHRKRRLQEAEAPATQRHPAEAAHG